MASSGASFVERFDMETVSSFTRKQSIEAFLPSRIVALSHVVEMLDMFAMELYEVALVAARNGKSFRLQRLVKHFDCNIVKLATVATHEGEKTKALIGSCIPEQRLLEAVGESDDLSTTKQLCSWCQWNRVEEKCLPRLLSSAAAKGRVDILEFAAEESVEWYSSLYFVPQPLPHETRVVRSKIRVIMGRCPELQRWYRQALINASDNDQHHTAEAIYSLFPPFGSQSLLELLVNDDDADAMQSVCAANNKRPFVHSDVMAHALNISVERSHCRVSSVLLDWGNIVPEAVAIAFRDVARAWSYDVATQIFGNLSRFNEMFERAVRCYIAKGSPEQLEFVKFLVGSSREIPRESIDRVFADAGTADCIGVMAVLCKSRYFSGEMKATVFRRACTNIQRKVLKFLWENGHVPSWLAAEVLVAAVRQKNVRVANYLWGQTWISRDNCNCISEFINAARMDDLTVVEWFSNHGRASRDAITTAFLAGASAGHVRVTKCLYDKQRASPRAMSDLLERTRMMEHSEVLDFLLATTTAVMNQIQKSKEKEKTTK